MDSSTVIEAKQWNYLTSEPFQMRYLLAAGLLRKFKNILEIGSYKTPIFQFIDDSEKNILTLDPMILDVQKSASQGSRMLDFRCLEMSPFNGEEYALVMLGMDLPITWKLKQIINNASLAVMEFTEDKHWKQSREQYDSLVAELELNELASVVLDLEGNDFSMYGGEDEWVPRTSRNIKVVSKSIKSMGELNGHSPFVKQLPEIDTRGAKLINTRFAIEKIMPEADFEFSHGANSEIGYVGGGMLYYSLAYMSRPKVCVCLGSGGAFVPRLMRQAQRDLGLAEHTRTLLVDGDMENFGRPNWLAEGSFFRENYPDVEVIVSTTAEASFNFKEQGLKIDYLHIDADHSFKGSLEDFDNYLPMMSKNSIMTFHDTRPKTYENVTCWKTLEEIRKRGFDVVDFNDMGAGVALIKIP